MSDFAYEIALFATAIFAITGVLAARSQTIDLIGIMVVGVVTAVGGGTIRDIILDVPVFWMLDVSYLWAAILAALTTFALRNYIQRTHRVLLYLDALGVALFAVGAVEKTLSLGYHETHAVVMGVITGIGGGIIRDLLTGNTTLIVSRDLYATPIILGVTLQILVFNYTTAGAVTAALLGGLFIFITRSMAVYYHWQMPGFLTINRD
jgi:uncharacterized membrane protein YeiH